MYYRRSREGTLKISDPFLAIFLWRYTLKILISYRITGLKKLFIKNSSKSYNPNMEPVFYLAGHIKVCIRGIEKISNSCKENNLPLPIYHINSGDIMVRFKASLD